MKDKKKIDELFAKTMDGFEAEPAMDAWPGVQNRLISDQRKKRMAYWRWGSTAAALILAFFGGYFFQLNQQPEVSRQTKEHDRPGPNILQHIPNENPTTGPPAKEITAGFDTPAEEGPINRSETEKVSGNEGGMAHSTSATIPGANPEPGQTPPLALNNQELEEKSLATAILNLQPLKSRKEAFNFKESFHRKAPERNKAIPLLRAPEDEIQLLSDSELQQKPINGTDAGFRLHILASPTFAFHQVNISNHDPLTLENVENEQTLSTFTAGLGLSYRKSGRWEWEAGVFVNQWQQSTENMVARAQSESFANAVPGKFTVNTSSGSMQLNNPGPVENFDSPQNYPSDAYVLVHDLEQHYHFLDIPLNLNFYLMENPRWAWKLKAGVSPRFVTHSETNLVYPNGNKEEVNGFTLNTFSLQALIGIGVVYRINQEFHLNFSPSLQYGLTPVNQHSDIDTYFHQVLIYSGLSYQF